jgi:hypothetical protein
LRAALKDLLARAGWALFRVRGRYMQDGLFTLHNHAFRDEARFRAAYRRGVEASHGFDPQLEWRLHVALWAASTSLHVPGYFVECGVNAGFFSSAIMQYLDWNRVGRRYFLIDTFSGPVLTQYSDDEIAHGRLTIAEAAMARGAFVTDIDRVRGNFAEWSSAVIVQGVVPEVLFRLPSGQVAFLHLDMNCAYPERAALEFLWQRLSPGAIVLLDDYAYFGHDRQMRAIDEAARRLGVTVLALPTGQGMIVKQC